jgi:hypothetical protein
MKDLDLDVRKQKLVVQSKTHLLNLYLPYPVDQDKGSAKFETDTCTLIVSVPIVRPDFPF